MMAQCCLSQEWEVMGWNLRSNLLSILFLIIETIHIINKIDGWNAPIMCQGNPDITNKEEK